MKKYIFLEVFSCFYISTTFAQLGVGLRGGYGASSTSQELVNGMKRTLGMNPTFGLMLNYDLDLHFSAGMARRYIFRVLPSLPVRFSSFSVLSSPSEAFRRSEKRFLFKKNVVKMCKKVPIFLFISCKSNY